MGLGPVPRTNAGSRSARSPRRHDRGLDAAEHSVQLAVDWRARRERQAEAASASVQEPVDAQRVCRRCAQGIFPHDESLCPLIKQLVHAGRDDLSSCPADVVKLVQRDYVKHAVTELEMP